MEDSKKRNQISTEVREAFAAGNPVAIPTETVYGLAAPIDKVDVLKKIFSLKERPLFDPLIVHVASIAQAKDLVTTWPKSAEVLANKFWPGPLTLVLPKNERVDSLITSGLSTVGLRMPRHPVALGLIEDLGVPLAAPSANKFTKTSPTSSAHVRKAFPDLLVIDGGEGDVGIESTIVRLEEKGDITEWTILRPGMVGATEIKAALENAGLAQNEVAAEASVQAPGAFEIHYQSTKPFYFTQSDFPRGSKEWLEARASLLAKIPLSGPSFELSLSADATLAARQFYSELHRGDDYAGANFLFLVLGREAKDEPWQAILNRIERATTKLK